MDNSWRKNKKTTKLFFLVFVSHFSEEKSAITYCCILQNRNQVLGSERYLWDLCSAQDSRSYMFYSCVLMCSNAPVLVQHQVHSSALHWCSLPQCFENNRGPSHTNKEVYGSVWCSLHWVCVQRAATGGREQLQVEESSVEGWCWDYVSPGLAALGHSLTPCIRFG